MSALIVDNLFKSILVKLDKIYTVKDGIIDAVDEDTSSKIKTFKLACSQKLDLQLKQFEIR
jgi:hypothetical protein